MVITDAIMAVTGEILATTKVDRTAVARHLHTTIGRGPLHTLAHTGRALVRRYG